jgi:hypothetical protein
VENKRSLSRLESIKHVPVFKKGKEKGFYKRPVDLMIISRILSKWVFKRTVCRHVLK